jgi:hypothetical protein
MKSHFDQIISKYTVFFFSAAEFYDTRAEISWKRVGNTGRRANFKGKQTNAFVSVSYLSMANSNAGKKA